MSFSTRERKNIEIGQIRVWTDSYGNKHYFIVISFFAMQYGFKYDIRWLNHNPFGNPHKSIEKKHGAWIERYTEIA